MLALLKKIFGGGNAFDFKALLMKGALIVDVRTPAEFKSGHIKGSVNIPLDRVKARAEELKKKNKPVITVCRSGNRSGVATSMLISAGIDCYNGGAWNKLNHKIS